MTQNMPFVYDDGGRVAAGYKGHTGDCFIRAFAIATELPYQQIYDMLTEHAALERPNSKRRKGRRSGARSGVWKATAHKIAYKLRPDWFPYRDDGRAFWTPTMTIGSGCRVHLAAGELPSGRLVACVSRHYTAVIDGVIHDTHDPQREPTEWIEHGPGDTRKTVTIGGRCVYGYWTF